MKFIILQDIPYRSPEGSLAQYHGIIWAEELRARGHEAVKMVIGDPAEVKPECPLLSVSTIEQRYDSTFWHAQDADCVLYYCGPNKSSLDVIRAIAGYHGHNVHVNVDELNRHLEATPELFNLTERARLWSRNFPVRIIWCWRRHPGIGTPAIFAFKLIQFVKNFREISFTKTKE